MAIALHHTVSSTSVTPVLKRIERPATHPAGACSVQAKHPSQALDSDSHQRLDEAAGVKDAEQQQDGGYCLSQRSARLAQALRHVCHPLPEVK